MRAPSLFVAGSSPLHRADPVTKGIWAICATLAGFLLPDPVATAALLAANMLLLAWARVHRRLLGLLLASLLAVFTFFVAQGLTHPANAHVAFRVLGVAFYREGLAYALTLALRLWNTIAAMGVLVLTTRPQDLVTALLMRGLPARAGYALVSVIQVLPLLWGAVQSILDAQRSRGVETDGGLRRRVRALVPVLGPLVMSSLMAAQDRAVALEVRGFGRPGRKTILNPVADMAGASLWRLLALAVLVAAIAWRVAA